jgi:protein-S-isoprenylcysteine O-methyltransferase Ste14
VADVPGRPGGRDWVIGWALVATQFALIGGLADEVARRRRAGAASRTAGVACILAGVAVLVGGSRTLGGELRAHPAPSEAATLRTDGLYRWVRHPIYSGLLLLSLGACLVAGTVRAWAMFNGLGWLLLAKSHFEERLLRARFPGYEAYARRTGRFMPLPRGAGQ